MTTTIFYSSAVLLLIISFFKDRAKTQKALKKAWNSFLKLIPAIVPMVLFVGIALTLISPEIISRLLGESSGLLGIFAGATLGSIAMMPSFVAFPLGQNLLNNGAAYPQVAVFIATLMAVGISTLSIEVKYFGRKVTLLRNIFALVASFIFAFLIGVIL